MHAGGIDARSLRTAPLCAVASVVNAAGLARAGAGAPLRRPSRRRRAAPHYFAKGNYFILRGRAPFSRLVYPVPEAAGLGVHLTLDLGGQAKFGPDVQWVASPDDLVVDPARGEAFYAEVRKYWPALPDGALVPGYAGIRPKISGPGEPARDFLIQGGRAWRAGAGQPVRHRVAGADQQPGDRRACGGNAGVAPAEPVTSPARRLLARSRRRVAGRKSRNVPTSTANLEAAANPVVEDLASDVRGVLSSKELESVPHIKALRQRVDTKLAIARELAAEKSKLAAKKAKRSGRHGQCLRARRALADCRRARSPSACWWACCLAAAEPGRQQPSKPAPRGQHMKGPLTKRLLALTGLDRRLRDLRIAAGEGALAAEDRAQLRAHGLGGREAAAASRMLALALLVIGPDHGGGGAAVGRCGRAFLGNAAARRRGLDGGARLAGAVGRARCWGWSRCLRGSANGFDLARREFEHDWHWLRRASASAAVRPPRQPRRRDSRRTAGAHRAPARTHRHAGRSRRARHGRGGTAGTDRPRDGEAALRLRANIRSPPRRWPSARWRRSAAPHRALGRLAGPYSCGCAERRRSARPAQRRRLAHQRRAAVDQPGVDLHHVGAGRALGAAHPRR